MQLIKYVCVAFLALFVNLISRHFLSFYISFSSSVIIAYILGHFVNFALSARYIFSRNISLSLAFIRFSIVALFGLLIALFVSVGTLWFLQSFYTTLQDFIQSCPFLAPHKSFLLHQKHLEFVAHISGVGVGFICNYLGHKYFSFIKFTRKDNK
ncbi:GtrA family protein [Helicobacter cinaedi]|uniref:GtrA family protein n=1 Tax=Helicobacter cinaedi TaxID=213 RepID=UPI000DA1E46D|nr:GtrA family protein [Helicobacter cinaedi]